MYFIFSKNVLFYFLDMKKTYIIIAVVLVLLLSIKAALKPGLEKKEVTKMVSSILVGWEDQNFSIAQNLWHKDKITEIPPIYNLLSHQIDEVNLYTEEKFSLANATVTLDFGVNDIFPSGRQWKFQLKDFKTGWRVMNFEMLKY